MNFYGFDPNSVLYAVVKKILFSISSVFTPLNSTVVAMSDDPVREWILSEGKATQIKGIGPIGGGCINRATRYDTDAGSFFVKTNRCFDYVLLSKR